MCTVKYVCVVLSVLIATQSSAQTRPATDVELERIRAIHELDQITDRSRYRVLSVEGVYMESQPDPVLSSTVRFLPYLVQDALCLMEISFKSAREAEGMLHWGDRRYGYGYWKGESARDCELEDASEIPADVLYTNEPLPTAALVQIVYRADELLRAALEYAINEADFEADYEPGSEMPTRLRRMYREYRDGVPLRLRSVDLGGPVPGEGFTYSATFGSENALEGPGVRFSVTPDGFVIHGVFWWIV